MSLQRVTIYRQENTPNKKAYLGDMADSDDHSEYEDYPHYNDDEEEEEEEEEDNTQYHECLPFICYN
jgi:hypothetical protein